MASPRRRPRPERDEPLARDLTPLEDPARGLPDPFRGRRDDWDQYEDLIDTGLTDSRVPRPRFSRTPTSPWVRARATYRSGARMWRDVKTLVYPPLLARRAVECAKRAIRREVLFALRRSGKGSGAKRRERRESSKWRC